MLSHFPLVCVGLKHAVSLQPAIFGGRTDGKGQSVVYYFTLPDGWEPDQVSNKAALSLLQRFVTSGQEADG